MTLTHILVFGVLSLSIGWLRDRRWRGYLILCASVLAVYWLQPDTPIRNLDFWLPTAALALGVLVWAITRDKGNGWLGEALLIAALVCGVAVLRYLGPACCLTATRPPAFALVLGMMLPTAGLTWLALRSSRKRIWVWVLLILLITIFLILKTDAFAQLASAGLRRLGGQDASLASSLDLRWLGYSYLAFRLIHVLRDRQLGKAHDFTLVEFTSYVLFFPALTAGPIDRSQRFVADLRTGTRLEPGSLYEGGVRLLAGVFKKFVIADSLAIFALNPISAIQTSSGLWAWVLLYAYALRIYFDFSGYTDIALGLGRWLGVRLPENFTAPYLKTNLTAFWNSWHITLAQWFRAYFFNPVTRSMRSSQAHLPVWFIILVGQAGTMLLIGLWHGLTWNFAIWGLWHAFGLFIHNRWSSWIQKRPQQGKPPSRLEAALSFSGWILTFHYVTLGWVWFALPDTQVALAMFQKLLGINP